MTCVPTLASLLAATPPREVTETAIRPAKEYVILFVARSGSSHLTDLLTSAGVGVPREWLNPAFLSGQAEAFGASDFASYFTRMRSRFTRNGIFGHEMTLGFYEAFSREVRLEEWFNFHGPAVFLFREDIIAQAVSLVMAIHRDFFHRIAEDCPDLPDTGYRPQEIRHYIDTFANEERGLLDLATRSGMDVRFVSYERHTAATPEAVVKAIARHVGASADLSALASRHRKLGDALNQRYAERFAAENADYCKAVQDSRRWLFDAMERRPLLQGM